MKSVDETISRIHPTVRALMALGSALVLGALLNNVFQSYIGIPAELEKQRREQRARDSIQDLSIRTIELENRQVKAIVEGVDLRDLVGVVRELLVQLCEERADRSGTLTTQVSRDCRRQAERLDPGRR